MEHIRTRVVFSKYFEAGEISPPFNSIMFANQGTTNVILQGLTIAPGQTYIDNGTTEEFNYTVYRFSFQGAGTNNLIVTKKTIVNGL